MSLNSCPTPDGFEIGRSQATQASAAGVPAQVEMNPVLLKPETEGRTQVVVMGRPVSTAATDSHQLRGPQLWDVVVRALDRLRREFDIVVIEGAGSPVAARSRSTSRSATSPTCAWPAMPMLRSC